MPADVDPDEAAAAMAAVMLVLQDEAEQDPGDGSTRWLLTGRLEALGWPDELEMARRWRRR